MSLINARDQALFDFDTLLENAPLGAFWVDSHFRLQQLNAIGRALFNGVTNPAGANFEEVSQAVWPTTFAREIVTRFRDTLRTGESFTGGNGAQSPFDDWRLQRISTPDGAYGVVCYFHTPGNTADREALLESEERYRATFANAAVGIAHVAMDGRWLRFNDAVCTITGYSREELIERTIEATLDTIRPAAEAKSIELTAKVNGTKAVMVMGDATRLQQIIWNLLSNAVKFTPNAGHVEIRLESDGSDAVISVSDRGQGISAEFLPHVFERFQQSDSRDTRKHGGLGLGLAIVRHLTERHGGTISAHSRGPNRGATFTLTLPLARRDALRDKPKEKHSASSQTTAGSLPDLRGVRVLAVDDEESARAVISAMLAHCGASVTVAASADEALRILPRAKPDILISDIGMPEKNGYDLLRSIRSLSPEEGANIPAVALTAYTNGDDRSRALATGFVRKLAKPVQPAELAETIESILAKAAKT